MTGKASSVVLGNAGLNCGASFGNRKFSFPDFHLLCRIVVLAISQDVFLNERQVLGIDGFAMVHRACTKQTLVRDIGRHTKQRPCRVQ